MHLCILAGNQAVRAYRTIFARASAARHIDLPESSFLGLERSRRSSLDRVPALSALICIKAAAVSAKTLFTNKDSYHSARVDDASGII
jgi:hypothetical protein